MSNAQQREADEIVEMYMPFHVERSSRVVQPSQWKRIQVARCLQVLNGSLTLDFVEEST